MMMTADDVMCNALTVTRDGSARHGLLAAICWLGGFPVAPKHSQIIWARLGHAVGRSIRLGFFLQTHFPIWKRFAELTGK